MALSAQQDDGWKLTPVEVLNTSGDEYAPRLESLGLLYSRSPVAGDSDIELRTELMYSAFRQNGLQEGGLFSEELSSPLHESSACLGPNADFVVFSRNSPSKRATTNFLYFSRIGVHDFQKAEQLPFNDSRFNTAHPSLDRSGKRLLFSSDRPGGYGGFDLYYAEYKDGVWSKAINLGKDVNSKSDEIFPFWGDNEQITFSSNRPGGFGGIDLYLLDASNAEWKRVKHLGRPFSSEGDDHGLSWSTAHGKGFLASNREGGKGGDDIYSFTFSDSSPISWLDPGAATDELVVLNGNREVVALLDDRNHWRGSLSTFPNAKDLEHQELARRFCGSFKQGASGSPDTIIANGVRIEIERSDIHQPLVDVKFRNAEEESDPTVYLTGMTGGVCLPSPSQKQSWLLEKQGFSPQTITVNSSVPFVEAQMEMSLPADSIVLRNMVVANRRIAGSLSEKLISSLAGVVLESEYQIVSLQVNLLSSHTPKYARAEADRLAKVIVKELSVHPSIEVESSGVSLFSDEGSREQARVGITAEALVEYELLLKKIPAGKGIGLNLD
ncbi:MAG: hypothetical protein AB8F78_19960 [Saprospiraceae bacterium]